MTTGALSNRHSQRRNPTTTPTTTQTRGSGAGYQTEIDRMILDGQMVDAKSIAALVTLLGLSVAT